MQTKIKALFILIIFLSFFNLFFRGSYVGGDLNYSYSDEARDQLRIPQLWHARGAEGFGESGAFILWDYPKTFIYSFVTSLGIPYKVTLIFLGYLPALALGFYGIYKIAKDLKLVFAARLVSSLLYLVNTYFLLLLDGGQLSIALAYSILPLAYFYVCKTFLTDSIRDKIAAGLAVVLLGYSDIRFVYLLFILLILRILIVELWNDGSFVVKAKSWLKSGFLIGIIFVLLNIYWLLPIVLFKLPTLPAGYGDVAQTNNLSFTNLGHSLMLLQPHWYKNVFGKVTALLPVFYLLPLAVFATPVFVQKTKEVKFWLVAALVGVFLAKGVNEPLGSVYSWLFENIPGFALFRDSTKFFVFICFSYSLLLGILINYFLKKIKERTSFLVFATVGIFLLVMVSPVWQGKMTGTFSKNHYEDNYLNLSKEISENNGFGRVLWLPSKPAFGYSSPKHPSVEAGRIFDERPFATSVVGSYEVFNFLREGKAMGEILDVFGIKYIGYPYPDVRREELKQDNIDYYHAFTDQLVNLPWIEKKISDYPITVLQANYQPEKFFLTEDSILVVGSDRIYQDIATTNFLNIGKIAFFFAEDRNELSAKVLERNPSTKILLYDKQVPDFVASTIPREYFIFPSYYLDFSPNESGWWKRESGDYLWLRNFLQEKYETDLSDFDYGGGYAISEGDNKLTIKSEKLKKGDFVLLRFTNTKNGGGIQIWEGEKKVGNGFFTNGECFNKVKIKLSGYKEIPDQEFTYECASFVTAPVAQLTEGGQITIEAFGGVNIVNAIISIPEGEYHRYSDMVSDLKFYDLYTASKLKEELLNFENKPEVSYQRISPTEYKLQVTGLERPSNLIFSEKFDEYWKIENRASGETYASLPAYSSLNSFFITENGEYKIYYEPQKYVLPGFIVSVASFLGVLIYLHITRKRKASRV